jgi:hypothetical protein
MPYLERVPDGLLAQVGVDGHHRDGLLVSKSRFLIPNSLIQIPYLQRVPDGLLAQVGVDGHHGDGLLEGTLGCHHPLSPAQ